jgi:hypothetical protein
MCFNLIYSSNYINIFLNKITFKGKKIKNYLNLLYIIFLLKRKNIKLNKLWFYIILKLKILFSLHKVKKKNKKKKYFLPKTIFFKQMYISSINIFLIPYFLKNKQTNQQIHHSYQLLFFFL